MILYHRAIRLPGEAGECIRAAFLGEDNPASDVGWTIVGEFALSVIHLVRGLSKGKK